MRISRKSKREVKINTTALPDIVFMLLFFFMVATTISSSSKEQMTMPKLKFSMSQAKNSSETLDIFFKQSYDDRTLVIDDIPFEWQPTNAKILNYLKLLRSSKRHIHNVALWIEEDMPMNQVYQLKNLLSQAEFYTVEYIHKSE